MENRKYGVIEVCRRLLKTASAAKGRLAVSTLASIVGNVSQMGLMGSGALLILSMAGYLNFGSPAVFTAALAVSAALIVLCRYAEGYVSHVASYELLASMRVHMFKVLRRLSPACLVNRNTGDLLSVVVADIETVEFFFAHAIGPLFTIVVLPVITLIVAFVCSPLYAACLLPVYLIICFLFPAIAFKAGEKAGEKYRGELGKLKTIILESVYSIRDIQIFRHWDKRTEMVMEKNQQVNRASHFLVLHKQAVYSMPTFFVYMARIIVIAVASYLASTGRADPAGAIFLSFVASASFSSTQSLTAVVSSLLETYAAAERMFTLEDTPPAVTEAEDPIDLDEIREIRFDNVSFRYNEKSPYILKNCSFTINKGDKIGVFGESGIGKSTVIRLLLRFWDPESGEITINDIPLKKYSLESIHRKIAELEQFTMLFDDTVAANIAFGRPEATRDEIVTAAKRAGIHELIMTLPDGYDTVMGQMNSRLSGGERQRIGIARTLIMEPDMIVMDEPTSNLDILNERGLLKTLSQEYSDKTLLIVSHRKSSLTICTRLLNVKDGKVIETDHM